MHVYLNIYVIRKMLFLQRRSNETGKTSAILTVLFVKLLKVIM